MFRTKVFLDGIRYPANALLTEDMALWFYLLSLGLKFANINEVLLDYRLNEDTLSRRMGAKKALNEVKIRTRNMFVLKRISFKNVMLIASRFVFHLMPLYFVKLAYSKARG